MHFSGTSREILTSQIKRKSFASNSYTGTMNSTGVFFLTGLVSSFHCIGMCGTFSASLVAGSSSPKKLQIGIMAGRFLSYTSLGALAGATGNLLFYQTYLAKIFLGTFAVSAGAYGLLLIRGKEPFSLPPAFKRIFSGLIPIKTPLRALAMGFVNPLLPCPILHAALALAVSSGGMINGTVSMAFFAMGTTVPLFISSVFMENVIRKTGTFHIKAAGGLILLASVFSLGRLGPG